MTKDNLIRDVTSTKNKREEDISYIFAIIEGNQGYFLYQ